MASIHITLTESLKCALYNLFAVLIAPFQHMCFWCHPQEFKNLFQPPTHILDLSALLLFYCSSVKQVNPLLVIEKQQRELFT